VLALGLAAAPAHAEPLLPPAGPILNGLSGSTSTQPFQGQVGSEPGVFGVFVKWGSLGDYVFDSAESAGARLMIHISTSEGQNMPEVISPGAIARGDGDAYLLRMNRRLTGWGQPAYVRLLAEMNQVNNPYAGFDRNGRSRGKSHSPQTFQKMWKRSTLILRGGPVAAINAKLAKLRLPAVRGVAADEVLGTPQVAMMWVPQTRGTPDIPANMPAAYWPGPRYVDWVGTDFYSRFPRFDWLTDFYNKFRGKPFVFAEWGMWGADDPGFVRQLFAWVRARPRVKMMLYNQGKQHRGVFRLDNYPRAKAEIKRQLARGR
jgi:hypothetical protein